MTEERVRIVGMVIKDRKLLMLNGRGYKELWTPGGKMKVGETDEDCLRRELREELQVNLDSCKFFKEYYGKSFYSEWMVRQGVYIIEISGEIKPSSEIEGHLWLSRKDFDSHKYPMIPTTEKEIIPDLIKERLF